MCLVILGRFAAALVPPLPRRNASSAARGHLPIGRRGAAGTLRGGSGGARRAGRPGARATPVSRDFPWCGTTPAVDWRRGRSPGDARTRPLSAPATPSATARLEPPGADAARPGRGCLARLEDPPRKGPERGPSRGSRRPGEAWSTTISSTANTRTRPTGEPRGPVWLRRWIGDEFFQEVTSVWAAGPSWTSDVFAAAIDDLDHLLEVDVRGRALNRVRPRAAWADRRASRIVALADADLDDDGPGSPGRPTRLRRSWTSASAIGSPTPGWRASAGSPSFARNSAIISRGITGSGLVHFRSALLAASAPSSAVANRRRRLGSPGGDGLRGLRTLDLGRQPDH